MPGNINAGLAKKGLIDNLMLNCKAKNKILISFPRNRESIFYKILFIVVFLIITNLQGQTSSFYKKSDTLHIKRRNAIAITETILATSALIGLDKMWYSDYPRSSFHFKNDNNHWKQMDKIGHVMTSYYVGKTGMNVLNWAGVSKKSINLWCNIRIFLLICSRNFRWFFRKMGCVLGRYFSKRKRNWFIGWTRSSLERVTNYAKIFL